MSPQADKKVRDEKLLIQYSHCCGPFTRKRVVYWLMSTFVVSLWGMCTCLVMTTIYGCDLPWTTKDYQWSPTSSSFIIISYDKTQASRPCCTFIGNTCTSNFKNMYFKLCIVLHYNCTILSTCISYYSIGLSGFPQTLQKLFCKFLDFP